MKTLLATLFLMAIEAHASGNDTARLGIQGRWGLGASITYPLAPIYEVQLSYAPWDRGELLTGFAYQNWENDQGTSHAYTVLAGYRQYVWKGLHLEAELWPAWNPFRSKLDGKTYSGLELWTSVRVGYRAAMELGGREFFLLAQPSLGFGVLRQNRWPGMGKGFSAPIFEPQVILGTGF